MAFGSMALLADGWHMGTQAAALGVAVFAYVCLSSRVHSKNDHTYTHGRRSCGAFTVSSCLPSGSLSTSASMDGTPRSMRRTA